MRKGGFTLIELLVVMAIIGILVGIMSVGLSEARKSSRDAQRKSNLEKIASGISLYRADCGSFPANPPTFGLPSPGQPLRGTGTRCPVSAGTNIYIDSIPDDPLSERNYVYVALSCIETPVGSSNWLCPRYRVWAALENAPASLPDGCPNINIPNCGSGSSVTCNYCVTGS